MYDWIIMYEWNYPSLILNVLQHKNETYKMIQKKVCEKNLRFMLNKIC